ncbi:MAG: 2-amino-4-hydroxy-6-hydroxymethyldihydropteridine diphosphokinase [Bryobacteraceae bacterium]|nr:2-amino-4-hydroxy-6-hydroxymethyldihydropteridine diphosphokinase [Bryobacteraceae bacterium]
MAGWTVLMKKIVYLSLGSNLGNREEMLRTAIEALHSEDCRIERVSPVYETEPMYLTAQGEFLNLVVEAHSTLFPVRLLTRIARIERETGRRRSVRNGPRLIDIDIVLFGKFVVNTKDLQIPHPRMAERRFVLEPLVELAPELRHPVTGKTMRQLLADLPPALIRRTAIDISAPGLSRQV